MCWASWISWWTWWMIMKCVLILKDIIEDLFNHAQTTLEHNIWELRATEYSLFHVFESYILKSKYFLCIMIGDKSTRHTPNLTLHNIFKEATSDQIVEFSLITWVFALILDDFIIQIVDIVEDFISEDWSSSCFKLKNDISALWIDSLTINLWT